MTTKLQCNLWNQSVFEILFFRSGYKWKKCYWTSGIKEILIKEQVNISVSLMAAQHKHLINATRAFRIKLTNKINPISNDVTFSS